MVFRVTDCSPSLAPSVANVQAAIEHVYPLVSEFSKERTAEEEARRNETKMHHHHNALPIEGDVDPLELDQLGFGLTPRHRRKRRHSGGFLNDPVDLVSDFGDDSSDSSDMEDVENFS